MSIKQTRKVTGLIERVNDWCSSVEEYLQDESSSMAEYCQSFGYGDGEVELDDLDEYTRPHVDTLFRRVKDKAKRREILADCSSLEFVSGYERRDNSIFSAELGECEEQMPDDLQASLSKLSDAEYEAVRKAADCYLPERSRSYWNCGYFAHDSDRWALILNVDDLYRKLQDIPEERLETHEQRRSVFRLVVGGAA